APRCRQNRSGAWFERRVGHAAQSLLLQYVRTRRQTAQGRNGLDGSSASEGCRRCADPYGGDREGTLGAWRDRPLGRQVRGRADLLMSNIRKYAFETEFTPDGEIMREPPKRITPEEVSAASNDGYERGKQDATAQAER